MNETQNQIHPLVATDSGWHLDDKTSSPSRGIRDYSRTITFTEEPSMDVLHIVVEYLKTHNCPGWTGVTMRTEPGDPRARIFRTTFDSSD